MTIVNTSFHIYRPVLDDFMKWLREQYVPRALSDGMTSPRLARIDFEPDPDTVSYAFSVESDSAAKAHEWHDGPAATQRASLVERLGEKVLFFTTYMETVEL